MPEIILISAKEASPARGLDSSRGLTCSLSVFSDRAVVAYFDGFLFCAKVACLAAGWGCAFSSFICRII